jgi:glycosyltransferase involved in cell wall biosynthesis
MSARGRTRVLVYTDATEVGGAEIVLGYLLGALSEQIEVGVLCVAERVGAAIAAHREGVQLMCVRAPSGPRDVRAVREHVRALRAFAPDILQLNKSWPWACGCAELAALGAPGVRVLAVEHLPMAVEMPRLARIARHASGRRVNVRVAVGEHAARMIEQLLALAPATVIAVPNGVPAAHEESQTPPRTRERLAIGSLGRMTEQKGYDLLVRALAKLGDAQLVLVGDGPQRASLEALARELEVAERLEVTGWSANPRGRLADIDVFALPSRWEGMPLGILEAMHAGLPVVGADVGSVSECVLDGDTGYVVGAEDLEALTDRLRRLLADEPLRQRMGERARTMARARFTDVAMALRYERVYETLLAAV